MAGILIALALLAALGLSGWRHFARGRAASGRSRALASMPGMSAENPLHIGSFTEMDDAVDELRCPCGGLLERIGEGGRPGVRVVRCACVVCEEDVDLFFDLSALKH